VEQCKHKQSWPDGLLQSTLCSSEWVVVIISFPLGDFWRAWVSLPVSSMWAYRPLSVFCWHGL
jgi:hypothetical protein